MSFQSYTFLFLLLPVAVAGWWLLNWRGHGKLAQGFLLLVSLAFYGKARLAFLPILLGSILFNFGVGKGLQTFARCQKGLLALGLLGNLGLLGYFKYANFFLENVNRVLGTSLGALTLLLPLGISFFTFQQIAYLMDCYRGDKPNYTLLEYACFVSFFPCVTSGPIAFHDEVIPQLRAANGHGPTAQTIAEGLWLFSLGMWKKVLLAQAFGGGADWGYNNIPALNSTTALAVVLSYTLQLYFDFSGYTDMARGIGKMMGVTLPENFDVPYASKSVTEFWRRWHMTLSGWFREYVYIPLGGNRKGLKRQIFNLFVVELLTGIWHGADWNFICWGLYYFILLAVEKLFLLKYLEKGKVWPHVYTLFLVVVGWAMFVGNDWGVGFNYLFYKLFVPAGGVSPVYFLRNYGVLLAVSVVCCTPLIEKVWDLLKKRTATRVATVLVLLVLSTAYVVGSTNSPFLYFNF